MKTKLAQEVKIQFHFGKWFLKPIVDKNKTSPDGSVEIKKAVKFLFFTYSNVTYFSVPMKQMDMSNLKKKDFIKE